MGNKIPILAVVAALMITAVGCSSANPVSNSNTPAWLTGAPPNQPSTGYTKVAQMPKTDNPDKPPPAVQDCAVVAISTPPRYACNGKTYTAYELAKARIEWEKKYASGK